MSPRPTVLLVNDFHPETIQKLDEKFQTHHLWKLSSNGKKQLIQELQGKCEAIATASWMVDEVIYELDSLKIISCFGVGVDGVNFKVTRSRNIRVSNTPDVLNDAVADIAIALVLATTRNIVNADRFVREKKWSQGPFPFGMGLADKTLGILGCGRIGEEIASRALTFGLRLRTTIEAQKTCPIATIPA